MRAHVPVLGLETNKMKFNKVLYLEGAQISVQVQDWGNPI